MTQKFPTPEPGQRLGDYEILAPLGAGGMGRVYKVRNVISNREEALKILLPDFASDPELAARFMAEIRTLAALDHPGIAQLRTAFQLNNQFVMVMEFVEGTGLDRLAVETRIPLDQILDYAIQALAALGYAHRRGVTHRDIKPANIMITSHGLVKLMDFGIAKSANDVHLTRPGTTMGSVYYMSPEQVRGAMIDARSDIYSFGVTLYELLTGCKPFEADSTYGVLNAHLNLIAIPPIQLNRAVSPELSQLVMRAMAKRPEDRLQTADEFRCALSARRGSPTSHVRPPVVEPPARSAASSVEVPESPHTATPAVTVPAPAPALAPAVVVAPPAPVVIKPDAGRRAVWIGIGAATATLALAALAAWLPRILATHASPKAADPNAPLASPVTPPPPQPVQPATPRNPPSAHNADHKSASNKSLPVLHEADGNPAPPVDAAAPVPSPELRNARVRYADLESRADSAISAVQEMGAREREHGRLIGADILGDINRTRRFLSEAHAALEETRIAAANGYMSSAELEISRLEKVRGN